jgi:hypothetical protein
MKTGGYRASFKAADTAAKGHPAALYRAQFNSHSGARHETEHRVSPFTVADKDDPAAGRVNPVPNHLLLRNLDWKIDLPDPAHYDRLKCYSLLPARAVFPHVILIARTAAGGQREVRLHEAFHPLSVSLVLVPPGAPNAQHDNQDGGNLEHYPHDLALLGQLAERFGKGRRIIRRLEVGPYQHSIRPHAVLKIIRHKLLAIEPFPHFSHFRSYRLPGIEPQLHGVQHGFSPAG